MKVLLTGGFGYVGTRLARSLSRLGHQVRSSGRAVPRWAVEAGALGELVAGDVTVAADARSLAHDVDAVIHLAALDENEAVRDPAEAHRVSRAGTATMLEAAQAAGVGRFIFFSTFHVYGRAAGRIDERVAPSPAHPYASAHLAGEEICRLPSGATVPIVVRLSNGYGAPVHREVARWTLAHNDFCLQAARDRVIRMRSSGEQLRDLVWLEDVAQATDLLLRAPSSEVAGEVFQVGGGRALSVLELAERVRLSAERRIGAPVGLEHPPASGEAVAGLDYSIDKIGALGYVAHDGLDLETDRLLTMLAERSRS